MMQQYKIVNPAQVYTDDLEEAKGIVLEVGKIIKGEKHNIAGQDVILFPKGGFISAKNAEQKSTEELIKEKSKKPIKDNRKLILSLVGMSAGYILAKAMGTGYKGTGILMVVGFGLGIVAAIQRENKEKIKNLDNGKG